jgi:hypothetical protein
LELWEGKNQEDEENYRMRRYIFLLFTTMRMGQTVRKLTGIESLRNVYINAP